ncbi:MAG: rhomboid family intramembrane serine protease [Chitinophagales bacterium]|nr:rhomboid family intramembrane serine protease [Chitinophagales bacterium]
MNRLTPAVKNLIILNVVMFLLRYVVMYAFPELGWELNSKLGLYYPAHPDFRPYQIFTHFFMHANEMHIAFNMISLFSVGSLLESYWGAKRVLNFYLICGIGAGIFYLLVQGITLYIEVGTFFPSEEQLLNVLHIVGSPAVGASGAVFGIFAAVALLFPNSEFYVFFIPFPIKAKYLLYAAVIISVLLGLANLKGDHIAHFAHLGGILTGYILTKFINKDKRRFY